MRKLSILFLFLTIIITGGVYANWIYATGTSPVSTQLNVGMGTFLYRPEEVLPGGGEDSPETPMGENHYGLIELILNENKKGYGLNINNNVLLHQLLKNNQLFFLTKNLLGAI